MSDLTPTELRAIAFNSGVPQEAIDAYLEYGIIPENDGPFTQAEAERDAFTAGFMAARATQQPAEKPLDFAVSIANRTPMPATWRVGVAMTDSLAAELVDYGAACARTGYEHGYGAAI